MSRIIGYYVHHQGRGHLARALAIARYQPECFVLLGSGLAGQTGDVRFIELAADLPDPATYFDDYARHSASLHYAPLGHAGIRNRVAALTAWIARAQPALIVCDVSVEIAMLARLTGTPAVYVRLNGDRGDPPHCEAFRAAKALLAPFHAELDDPATPAWVREKTAYFPGIATSNRAGLSAADIILVVNGAGGEELDGETIASAARAMPAWRWRVIGPASAPLGLPANMTILGWIEHAEAEIADATVIVGAPGDGLVGAVIAAKKRFLALPQPRPFNEQHAKASRLAALGAAIALQAWPPAEAWPALIERALSLDLSPLKALHDPDGAKKACNFLTSECMKISA